ncbi:MAG: hypothetical protein ACRDHX_06255, partial [Chloroflexota bacterium]
DNTAYAATARPLLAYLRAAGVDLRTRDIGWSQQSALLRPSDEDVLGATGWKAAPAGGIYVWNTLPRYIEPAPNAVNVARVMLDEAPPHPEDVERWAAMDLLWVPSQRDEERLSKVLPAEKLRLLPELIDLASFQGNTAPVAVDAGQRFTFLSIVEWTAAQGADAVVQAFLDEFRAADGVSLLLLLDAADASLAQAATNDVRTMIARSRHPQDPPPVTIHFEVADMQLPSFFASAAAYLQVPRETRWNRRVLEAAASHLPLIATDSLANQTFLSRENSYVVARTAAQPMPAPNQSNWRRGERWLEPSKADLQAQLRHVVQDRDKARRRANAAYAAIAQFDTGKVGPLLLRLLAEAGSMVPRANAATPASTGQGRPARGAALNTRAPSSEDELMGSEVRRAAAAARAG